MSEQEQLEFCGILCMAARRMRMPIIDYGHAFAFIDKQGGVEIRGIAKGDRKACLVSACEQLQKYFGGEVSNNQ